MLTSKLPVTLTSVPECVLAVHDRFPQMAVNLRPDQRPGQIREFQPLAGYAPYCYWMDDSVLDFILKLRKGMNVAMLFQDNAGRIGYMIVRIKSIFWSPDGGPDGPNYPRLDFDWPEEAVKFFEAPNFWGSFILAIARVSPSFEPFFLRDAFCENFLTCVRTQRRDEVL
jgi:hypothetical protein